MGGAPACAAAGAASAAAVTRAAALTPSNLARAALPDRLERGARVPVGRTARVPLALQHPAVQAQQAADGAAAAVRRPLSRDRTRLGHVEVAGELDGPVPAR